jgi:O-antigen/teichoic acid export membrane protein
VARLSGGRVGATIASLPAGTIPVGIGLLVAGLSAYGFQIIAFRMLGAQPYASLNGLWVTAFVLAPGLFLPLEQEVARALAHRRAQGDGGQPLITRAIVLAAFLIIGVVVVALAARGFIEARLLRSSDDLFIVLIAALVGYGVASLARGLLSGNNRFGRYGAMVGMDGFARVALAAVIALIGYGTLGWFGVVFATGPFLATLVGLVGIRGLGGPGSKAPMSELTTSIGWLLLGSIFAGALGYSAYIGASVLSTKEQDAELGSFIAALFVARIPLLLFQAVQAALLPKLAGLLGQGKVHEFRIGMLRLLSIVTVGSVIGVAIAFTAGPAIGRLLFGVNFTISGIGLAALTAGCCLMVIALTLAQALIALRRYAVTAFAWVVSLAIFVVAMSVLTMDVFTRAEIAFVGSAFIAVIWMAGVTWRSTSIIAMEIHRS